MFGKNKQKKQEEILQEKDMPQIHVMPSVFLSTAAQKIRLKKKKKIRNQEIKKPAGKPAKKRLIHPLILVLIVLLAATLGGAVFYLLAYKKEPENVAVNNPPAVETANQTPPVVSNTTNNAPQLFCGDKIISANLGEECDDGNQVSEDGCSSQCRAEVQPSFTQQITPFTSYPTATDSDEDFLTDAEENLYSTGVNNMDEDGDTYLDGLELINLYNPKLKTPASLVDSGLINIFNNQEQGYSLFYPKGWKVRYVNVDKSEVSFESSTVEFAQVLVSDNPQKESITAWAKKQFPDIEISKLERVGVGDKLGIKSPNGLTVNFANEDKIYSVTYQISTLRNLNFKATFQMMYNSLKLYSRNGGVEPMENQWSSYINNQLGVKLQYPVNLEVAVKENNIIQIDDFGLQFIDNAEESEFDSWFWKIYGKKGNESCQLKDSELKIGKLNTFFVDKMADQENTGVEKQCKDGGYYAVSGDKKRIIKLNIGESPAREMAQILATMQLFEPENAPKGSQPAAENAESKAEPELPLN
ncbi:MAG: myxococcus cysteine-rich repeat containing protein [bacterium]